MADDASALDPRAGIAPPSPARALWNDFAVNRGAVTGLAVLVVILLIALFADLIALHDPMEQFRQHVLQPFGARAVDLRRVLREGWSGDERGRAGADRAQSLP